ncbi:hypothetical protein GCM10010503_36890 [Streptomyces lucensis JCM 4490]|uniref:Uncharacterized protein n=1 Tax=Streptomyces lucensis JCM 4490 TaxID=1306176 RepID=A0A918J7P8_9ACTN|nr:hypothetical protein GCM10010503_36890 [Streptomyces lucensis JCM 4490]
MWATVHSRVVARTAPPVAYAVRRRSGVAGGVGGVVIGMLRHAWEYGPAAVRRDTTARCAVERPGRRWAAVLSEGFTAAAEGDEHAGPAG